MHWPFDQPFHVLLNIAVGGNWEDQGVDQRSFPVRNGSGLGEYINDKIQISKCQIIERLISLLVSTGFRCVAAQDDVTYKTPPKEIMDLVLAKPTPGVNVNSKGEWMILTERSDFPTIEDMAQPELRIAGLRINPRNFGPSRTAYAVNIQIQHIPTKKIYNISGLPQQLKASSIQWSPDEKKFAFTNSSLNRIDLYIVELDSKTARRSPVHSIRLLRKPRTGNDKLIYKIVPANYKKYPDVRGAKWANRATKPGQKAASHLPGPDQVPMKNCLIIRNGTIGLNDLVENPLPALLRRVNAHRIKIFAGPNHSTSFSYLVPLSIFHEVNVTDRWKPGSNLPKSEW